MTSDDVTRDARQTIGAAILVLAVVISIASRLDGPSPVPGLPSAQARHDAGAIYDIADLPKPKPLTFEPGVAPADQQAVTGAITRARPAARALMERVQGLVTIHVGGTGRTAVGVTQANRDGTFDVTLDLATVFGRYGTRGVDRVVQHEMGHVVDFAIVGSAVDEQLDAGIPRGWGCDDGRAGSCAARAERFAESFAKWASGDLGVDLYLGYKVPPPSMPLDTWAAPLAKLAAAAAV